MSRGVLMSDNIKKKRLKKREDVFN